MSAPNRIEFAGETFNVGGFEHMKYENLSRTIIKLVNQYGPLHCAGMAEYIDGVSATTIEKALAEIIENGLMDVQAEAQCKRYSLNARSFEFTNQVREPMGMDRSMRLASMPLSAAVDQVRRHQPAKPAPHQGITIGPRSGRVAPRSKR